MALTAEAEFDTEIERDLFSRSVPGKAEPLRAIVVGVTGSAASTRAAQMAARLASGNQAKVVLVFASKAEPGQMSETERTCALSLFDDFRRTLGLDPRRIKTVLEAGDPAAVLGRLAAAEHADLVAIGTRRESALVRGLTGGIAEHLSGLSGPPILIVR